MANVLGIIRQPITDEWETPPDFFRALDSEFGFQLDAAATSQNAKCPAWLDKASDGLAQRWCGGPVWCNPPYGTQIGRWVRKGHDEAQWWGTVVMLVPARTETAWWHDYIMKAAEIRLVRGRLRFSGSAINAPFPSAVVIFRPGQYVPRISAIGRDGRALKGTTP